MGQIKGKPCCVVLVFHFKHVKPYGRQATDNMICVRLTKTGTSCSTGNTLSESSIDTASSSFNWLRPSSWSPSSSERNCARIPCDAKHAHCLCTGKLLMDAFFLPSQNTRNTSRR